MECLYCGRRELHLYQLTAEDIQREHIRPGEMVCADCLGKIRLAANLVPEQSLRQTFRNFSWMIPLFSLVLFLLALGVSSARINGLGQLRVTSGWLGVSDIFVGTMIAWERTKHRYGFTHDLRWSLNSRRVNIAFAILIAGIVTVGLSAVLPR